MGDNRTGVKYTMCKIWMSAKIGKLVAKVKQKYLIKASEAPRLMHYRHSRRKATLEGLKRTFITLIHNFN